MSAINDLIRQIKDPDLREKIQKEVNKMAKQKKFGLVFEEHLPECTPLWDMPVRRGAKVSLKSGSISDFYHVIRIKGKTAVCVHHGENEEVEFPINDIVPIAEFGEAIYPYLKPIDTVCNAPDSDLWHTLIEADNYHALQLLEYLYPGKVDCIYIDPPYNTGAKDWKYNNDYVDSADQYRHSKWLSFMQRRLRLAKKMLNPKGSVLIVTIDEKEYLHLGCLLEELFADARIQMVSSVINPKGQSRNGLFARTDEYIFFVFVGDSIVQSLPLDEMWRSGKSTTTNNIRWQYLRRPGKTGQVFRHNSPGCFYPIFVRDDLTLHSIGNAIPLGVSKETIKAPKGTTAIWPICADGREGCYQVSPEKLKKLYEEGFLHITEVSTTGIHYLKSGEQQKVRSGVYKVLGYRENDHSVIVESGNESVTFIPGTQWNIPFHNAGDYGKKILNSILSDARFTYPKSLYAVSDCLRFILAYNSNALVVDFFAGSGTTLHAVNLLNAEDGGHRRCIIVTNNEVSDDEANDMIKRGLKPGDEEWEKLGIARYVTWPRTVCSIEGHDMNGTPLNGNYHGSDLPLENGFKANAAYFKLGFLDKTAVALGMQFMEMLPTLWMKAGAHGPCPSLTDIPADMLILPKNRMAILLNENAFSPFARKVNTMTEIETVFIITDYEINYRNMVGGLNRKTTFQLYRDYLDNFRINCGRN